MTAITFKDAKADPGVRQAYVGSLPLGTAQRYVAEVQYRPIWNRHLAYTRPHPDTEANYVRCLPSTIVVHPKAFDTEWLQGDEDFCCLLVEHEGQHARQIWHNPKRYLSAENWGRPIALTILNAALALREASTDYWDSRAWMLREIATEGGLREVDAVRHEWKAIAAGRCKPSNAYQRELAKRLATYEAVEPWLRGRIGVDTMLDALEQRLAELEGINTTP